MKTPTQPCSEGCTGVLLNGETLKIERCDECNFYVDDIEAEKAFIEDLRKMEKKALAILAVWFVSMTEEGDFEIHEDS